MACCGEWDGAAVRHGWSASGAHKASGIRLVVMLVAGVVQEAAAAWVGYHW